METTNSILLDLLKSCISHFWIITICLIASSLIKKGLYLYIELRKLEISNKNSLTYELEDNFGKKHIEILSSDLKIKDVNKELLLIDFKKTEPISNNSIFEDRKLYPIKKAS